MVVGILALDAGSREEHRTGRFNANCVHLVVLVRLVGTVVKGGLFLVHISPIIVCLEDEAFSNGKKKFETDFFY